MKFKGKVALVTGGSGGIGSTVSRALAREGAKVVIFSRDKKALKRIAGEIQKSGGVALPIFGDVSRHKEVQRAVNTTIQKFKRLDILVNCAGVQEPIGLFAKSNIEKWKKNIEVNLLGTVYFAHAALPHMLKRKSGNIAPEVATELVQFLASDDSHVLSGKLIAAVWDGWRSWTKKDIEKIQESDMYTLRRVT